MSEGGAPRVCKGCMCVTKVRFEQAPKKPLKGLNDLSSLSFFLITQFLILPSLPFHISCLQQE